MTRRRELPSDAASSPEGEELDGYDALPLDGLLDQSFDVDAWFPLDEPEVLAGDPGATSSDGASRSDVSEREAARAAPIQVVQPKRRHRVPQSQRVRAEQTELRDQIAALERQLADLLASRAVAHLAAPRTAWRAVAKRQAARRQFVEQENERLHAQLARHRQLARQLEAAIQDSIRDFMDRASPRIPPSWRPVQHDIRGDFELLLDQFMADIDYAYSAVDAVLPGTDFDAQIPLFERPPSRSSVRALATDGSHAPFYTELRQALALPFSLEKINSVLWQVVSGEFARQHREIERYRYSQGVHACKILVPPSSKNATTTSAPEREDAVTTISRLFVEADRTVLIWRSFRATLHGGSFSEAQCLNTGWVVFRSLEAVEDHVVVHACSRGVPLQGTVIPTASDDPASPLARTSEVQEFLRETLRATENKVPSFIDAVENVLLDGAGA